jgi:putative nucleotidyltransferase with HDIG domain
MTSKSYNQFRMSNFPRSTAPRERSNRAAPFGSASTRPPSSKQSPGKLAPSAQATQSNAPVGATAAIDETNWFGTNDQAVAEETAGRSMAALVGRIIGAKPFPMSARRLADLTRLDVVRIEPVIQVLESDPGLSARLLRLVNSAGYALRQRCTSVRHAATLVGTDRLHQIATTAAVLDLFDSKGPFAAQIIEHSTVVGAFCRYLGAHLALPVDDLFTAGFLHDIGKLMLMETEGDQYVELLTSCASQPDSIHLLERKIYGFDHAALAAHVLSAWSIPEPVPKIVAWHHAPAQAYKASSLMASLVQTIRLSDAMVYTMRRGADRAGIKDLANHEAAGYLEISEPQLAAMWNELQVLFDECQQQCLGENAPALDPRSLRPRQTISSPAEPIPSERTHDLPKQFACVECGCPTFGNTCPACNGYVCPEHQVGNDAWCTICARDYKAEKKSIPVPLRAKWTFAALGAAILLSGILGMFSSGAAGALRAGFGTMLLGLLMGLLYVIGRTWLVRSHFRRSRPNRFIAEPQFNDGGTKSLAPTMGPDCDDTDTVSANVDWLKTNLHLVEPLKEITIRELSGPDPSNESDMPLPPDATVIKATPTPLAVIEARASTVDSVRVQLQSESLVTLPAPAHDKLVPSDEAEPHERDPANPRRRSPRDTLNEHNVTDQLAMAAPPSWDHSNARIGTFSEEQSGRDGGSARKTDPGPEAQFARPFVTFRAAHQEAETTTDNADGTPGRHQCDDLDNEPLSSRLALTMPNQILRPVSIDVSQASVELAIAQPILAIDAEPRTNEDRRPTLHSAAASSLKVDGAALSASENPVPFFNSPSVHPLAALGIRNQPPRMISEPATAPTPEADSTGLAAPAAASMSETPDLTAQPYGPEKSFVTQSTSEVAPLAAGQLDSPIDIVSQDDTLKRVVGDLVTRFGSDFEAQVRELAAQRVAQMVAERFMAAFDTSSLAASTKRSPRHSSIATPREPTVPSAIQEPKVTTRPGRKKRRPE